MTGVMEIRDHLLQELELAVMTSGKLIGLINESEWDFRPQENMRTLLQLVHHLVAIPASDLAIMQEKVQQEVEQVENAASGITDPALLSQRFEANFENFKTIYSLFK